MTIKQIFLLTFAVIATQMHGSQGPTSWPTTHATRTVPQGSAQSAKRTPQHPTLPQPTVTIINGPLINYGTAYIGTVNRAPHGMPQFGQQQKEALGNMGNNQFFQMRRTMEAQSKYAAMQHIARQQTAQPQTAQQQEFLRNKAEEDKKMQESQKAAYAQLQELIAAKDFLPLSQKQANQLKNATKLNQKEGYVVAESIITQFGTPEIQTAFNDFKPFKELLQYADTLEFSTPPTQKTTYDPVSRPIAPKKFLSGQPTLQYTTEMPAKPICTQLGLTSKQENPYFKIV
jgi:hypothetical protein